MTIKILNLILIGLFFLPPPALQGSAGEGDLYLITDLSADSFPQIEVQFRAIDRFGKPIDGLTNDDLSLFEDGRPIGDFTLVEHHDAPINLIYVVDLGEFVNYSPFGLERIRRALTYPATSGYFEDGYDTALILLRGSDGQDPQMVQILEPSQKGADLIDTINSMSFNPSDGLSEALLGIEDAMGEAIGMDGLGESATSILFLTHILDTFSETEAFAHAERLAGLAREKRISIFTFQSRIGGPDSEALTLLAQETGGEYLHLSRQDDQREDFERIYGEIASRRTRYTVTFRSDSDSSDVRKVAIGPPGGGEERTTSFVLFGVDLLPPDIQITSPRDGETYTVEADTDPEGGPIPILEDVTIRAALSGWPDGYPREVVRVEFLVDDAVVHAAETDPEETQFAFTWRVDSVRETGVTSFPLQVRVVDELGIEALSELVEIDFNVSVEKSYLETCLGDPLTTDCLPLFLIPLVLLTAAAAAVIILFFFFRRRAQTVTEASPRQTLIVPAKKEEAPEEALAKLEVLEGPPSMVGTNLEVRHYVTTLGRDPEKSMISFFPEGNTSVSGKHCTLQLYYGKFYIIDDHSLNGTTVNGKAVEPGKPHPLSEGDEIVLGDPAIRGVHLRLSITEAAKGHAGVDATQYGKADQDSVDDQPPDSDAG